MAPVVAAVWVRLHQVPSAAAAVPRAVAAAAVPERLRSLMHRTRAINPAPPGYSNLWVIRLSGEGRASSFTEWMEDRGVGVKD